MLSTGTNKDFVVAIEKSVRKNLIGNTDALGMELRT